MSLHILVVGKKHENWVAEGILRYQKRLKAPFIPEWVLMAHSSFDGLTAREDESRRILSRLNAYDYIILMDERGKTLHSPTFADVLKEQLDHSRKVLIIIGGAYGVTQALREKADLVWSLSPLVFPHQLVRLIVIEQLYRAQQITLGGPYHHT
ncbi:MAG: 23S rRNA (pseudouridine(1915)-N(3))-methyltransferase RlmH [Candidatus Microsaccharimonas sossegonensis]|uniref:Ribosomal RNA large subunit methyltransferase H n=1 Tax=Candidatus Microsaccharimonas sossegonensis TaxID=2506948 RepID=A0A4Q0AGV1_9BACT|nr:MAG: 23S rRNA (pseudouridine(1915)-N(3))-methyltransferase RlmH [Candidatus Microsaccharimonas sossegonensis]